MAAEDEGRTEEPSEYRLEKARKEGRVAKSQEVSGALILLMTVFLLVFMGKWIFIQCTYIYKYYFSRCSNPDLHDKNLITTFFNFFLRIFLPLGGVSAVAAVIGNIIQTRGFVFSLKPIQPDFSRILPHFGNYLKKTVFSFTGFFNFIKSIVKIFIIVLIAYFMIRNEIPVFLMIISNGQILEALGKIAALCAKLMITVSVLFLVISIPDYFVQKREFMESQKMTKQEVKQEFKELEGDPEVKNRLKQAQQELLKQNLRKTVSEADVVVANPTHYAVCLKYEQNVSDVPVVTAKGEDQQALLIRHIAEENNVPVVENRPVARELYTNIEVGDIIPEAYYTAIALIYANIGYKVE